VEETGEEGSVRDEARRLLAAARAWLEEWAEEGVETRPGPQERPGADAEAPAPSPPTPTLVSAGPAGPPAERPVPHPPPQGGQLGLEGGAPLWPARPTVEQVRQALGECTRCRLHEGRTQIVFADGSPEAELMFVGEGPGEQEDLRGIPFCGRAGELLTRMIENGLGISRREVYICNIVKCRPPGNRTPAPDEVATCRTFLDGQIDAVRPRVIVALGRPAASLLLGRDVPITRVRGSWHDYRGIPVMPTYHPAFLLRQYTLENRRLVWEDLKAAYARARGER